MSDHLDFGAAPGQRRCTKTRMRQDMHEAVAIEKDLKGSRTMGVYCPESLCSKPIPICQILSGHIRTYLPGTWCSAPTDEPPLGSLKDLSLHDSIYRSSSCRLDSRMHPAKQSRCPSVNAVEQFRQPPLHRNRCQPLHQRATKKAMVHCILIF